MKSIGVVGLCLAPLLAACATETTPATDSSDIIGGVDASSAALDAIGTVGNIGADEVFTYFCTATLIGPKVVLTAKHCASRGPTSTTYLEEKKVYFAVGADSRAPKQVIEAVDVLRSPVAEGGFGKFGSDVAVYILAEPVQGVEPMAYLDGHIKPEEVGRKLTAVGYGVQDRARNSGTRRAGTLTLQAVDGQPLHKLFPTLADLNAYLAQYETEDWFYFNSYEIEELYDLTLLEGLEAYAGLGADDAQPCNGDSGGPLVANIYGKLTVAAVVSGSFKGETYPCSTVGEVYATLGESVQPMIASALGPCEGVPVEGRCQGTVAERCVSEAEGPVKITRTDCEGLAQTCGMVDGKAVCVEPS